VDVVIPIMSVELETMAKNEDMFREAGVVLSVSSLESLKIANNKLALFEYMRDNDIPVPKFWKVNSVADVDPAIEHIGVPVVFKTNEGSGSRGMRIIDPSKSRFDILFHEKPTSAYVTLQDFKETLQEGDMPPMMAMEYLPGNEYTVDMLCENGKVLYNMCRRGLNVQTSIILDGVVEDKPEITGLCAIVAEKLKLTGNIGFDVKERPDGTPVIMECNPRATAGVSEFTASGVNLLYLNIKRCLGEPLPELTPKYGVIMKRRYQEMYWG
jgi:carbamoyl-phosphate synthase large subunit